MTERKGLNTKAQKNGLAIFKEHMHQKNTEEKKTFLTLLDESHSAECHSAYCHSIECHFGACHSAVGHFGACHSAVK
jgi:hypothetical protein